METVNVHEAKTHFSKLLDKVEGGEEIIVARAGKPVAKLVPIRKRGGVKLGLLEGQYTVPEDFDTAFEEEIIALFEGTG